MTGVLANKSMGDLVENDLFYLIQGGGVHKVFADGDSPSSKVTLSGSPYCPVKTEAVIDQGVLNKQTMG